MMQIRQFRYFSDNFGYVIHGNRFAAVIDGGSVEEILSFVARRGLKLVYVANTHGHDDHTTGTKDLLEASHARYLDYDALTKAGRFEIEGNEVAVYATPGHTLDSIVFYLNHTLLTGDTLFNGTIGNCFSGDMKAFYESITRLMRFPGDTVIYAGHDYVEASMKFGKFIEPDNKHIDAFLMRYTPVHVYSTLDDELKINPYLRFNAPAVVNFLEQRGLPVGTEYERWVSLMSIE